MKRLRIGFDVRTSTAPQPEGPHVGPRHARYLQAFKRRATRYRNRQRIAVALMLVFLLACAALAETPIGRLPGLWGAVLLLACWLVAVGILLFGQGIDCPACGKRLMRAPGPYCPQCGSSAFAGGGHTRGAGHSRRSYCPSCNATIYDGDNEEPRSYRLRGCTHCGVMLDEKGL